jgi:hypothetical protein
MSIRPLPVLILSQTLMLGVAHAGTSLETVNRDLSGDRSTTINTWAQDGMMRVESQSNDSTMIFKDDTIYGVNHKDKSYIVMDRASMKRMADQVNPSLKLLQEQMKNMTPEQRAQLEKMLGRQLPSGLGEAEPQQQIKRTSRSDRINGHSCTYVEVREGGVLTDEMCVALGNTLQGSAELMNAAKRMSTVMQDMMAEMDAPWLKQMAQKQLQNFEALGGIPVLSRHFVDGKPQSETTISNVRSEKLAATMFDIPAGYTKKDMMAPR